MQCNRVTLEMHKVYHIELEMCTHAAAAVFPHSFTLVCSSNRTNEKRHRIERQPGTTESMHLDDDDNDDDNGDVAQHVCLCLAHGI